MLGYNGMTNQELNLGDPFKGGRNKLRPLVPRPYLSPPSPTNHRLSFNTTTTHHHHHQQQQHHFGAMGPEEGKSEVVGTHQVQVSSRWNPTPEQLRALEELYRRGTRTPSAEQIQHITSQLRCYGKIEGKNVFYWFQNHKARERQKRRRQLQPNSSEKGSSIGGKKDNAIETEQKSCKWATSSLNKESDLTPGVTKEAQTTTTTTSSILPQFQHNHMPNNHIHNNINNIKNLLLFTGERNATWHTHNDATMVQTPFCSCCYPSLFPLTLSSPKIINSSSSTIIPKTLEESRDKLVINGGNDNGDEPQESPTLQLFPIVHVKQDDHDHKSSHDNDDEDSNERANINNPFPYYHFL